MRLLLMHLHTSYTLPLFYIAALATHIPDCASRQSHALSSALWNPKLVVLNVAILFGEGVGQLTKLHLKVGYYSSYRVIKEVGAGTYGNVWQAVNKENGELVAIKKMKKKFYSWEECINLREVQCLRKLKHPNIVKLMEVIKEQDVLCFVFEYMECSLYEVTKGRDVPFTEYEIKIMLSSISSSCVRSPARLFSS
ncbi:hypothetical protein HPP92_008363 [Vanilla planifolia]|uniref:Protein kinase domain-containing protein n=1 Tax=Vanilla planifolia TaxID=51239 RepID=A0A835V1W8_VANPL|nr:hypothetical protein HPP92_008363 [Vanilla planifolia]